MCPHFLKVRLTIALREGRLNTSRGIGVYVIKEQQKKTWVFLSCAGTHFDLRRKRSSE